MIQETATRQEANEMAHFRSRLRYLILSRSLEVGRQITQSEAADEANVSFSTIQRWYDPDYTFNWVDADTLNGLIKYFRCTFEDLVEFVD